ncbi:MAG TPA: DUF892 family protein [Terracidiphilus sp.]|nr:DUF892 family protein [Terracidiphilus sp.]
MKWLNEDFRNLRALYVNQLRVLLDAEEQIVRAMPNMVVRATDPQLRGAFQSHLQETEEHIKRLEQILVDERRVDPAVDATSPIKCHPISALVNEAEDFVTDTRDAWVRDASLILAAQRIEHYEIASYGALRQWAILMGRSTEADLLDRTIKEEGHADHLLTSIAERVNPQARRAAA